METCDRMQMRRVIVRMRSFPVLSGGGLMSRQSWARDLSEGARTIGRNVLGMFCVNLHQFS